MKMPLDGMDGGKQTYRFALYGQAAAGKTCMLAALAMPHVPHPLGYTCTWLPAVPGLPLPAGHPAQWNRANRAAAFHLGLRWLDQARDNLLQGKVPEPTPPGEPVFFIDSFTRPGLMDPVQLELIDYAGELVNARLVNDSDLAKSLLKHLTEMDGILVLAEAPTRARRRTSSRRRCSGCRRPSPSWPSRCRGMCP
jgi:hypothetical protein